MTAALIRPDHVWQAHRARLAEDTQLIIQGWARGSERPHLYVHGRRRIGSSYVAEVAVREVMPHLAPSDRPIFAGWKNAAVKVTALDLVAQARQQWHRRDDDEVTVTSFTDMFALADLLWIDDFHLEERDYDVFDTNVRTPLEDRLKDYRLTVISGSRDPGEFGSLTYFLEDEDMFLDLLVEERGAAR